MSCPQCLTRFFQMPCQFISRPNGFLKCAAQCQNISISAHQRHSSARLRECQKNLVFGVAAGWQVWPRLRQVEDIRVWQELADQVLPLLDRQVELGIAQNQQKFIYCFPANQWPDPLPLPSMANPGQPPVVKQKRGYNYIGVKNYEQHYCLAQRIASATSCSIMPNCSNLSRTALASCILTGVRTILPPSTVTSKYSVAAMRDTTALGSVIWFLEVSFASMTASLDKSNHISLLPLFQELFLRSNAKSLNRLRLNKTERDFWADIGKTHTVAIERDNSNTRHHLARFTRRTKVVSKKREMGDLTLRLWHAVTATDLFHSLRKTALSIYR